MPLTHQELVLELDDRDEMVVAILTCGTRTELPAPTPVDVVLEEIKRMAEESGGALTGVYVEGEDRGDA